MVQTTLLSKRQWESRTSEGVLNPLPGSIGTASLQPLGSSHCSIHGERTANPPVWSLHWRAEESRVCVQRCSSCSSTHAEMRLLHRKCEQGPKQYSLLFQSNVHHPQVQAGFVLAYSFMILKWKCFKLRFS